MKPKRKKLHCHQTLADFLSIAAWLVTETSSEESARPASTENTISELAEVAEVGEGAEVG